MECILKYFPNLTDTQKSQFRELGVLYLEWNEKINLISRKDMASLYEHHILHSLGIAKIVQFRPGAEILDLGTGGGMPGIPLAILFPECHFTLVDGTGKKIMVVSEISKSLGLKNVTALHMRAEDVKKKFDFVVTRGVASLDKLIVWTRKLYKTQQKHSFPNGLLALKGGKLKEEVEAVPKGNFIQLFPLSDYFKEPFYEEKFLVFVQA